VRDVVVADVLVLVEVRSRASHPLATVTELVVRAKLLVQPLRYTTPFTADSTDPVKQYKLILIIIINDDGDCMLKQSFVSTHLTGTQLQFLVSAQVVFKHFPPLQSCVAFSFPTFFLSRISASPCDTRLQGWKMRVNDLSRNQEL